MLNATAKGAVHDCLHSVSRRFKDNVYVETSSYVGARLIQSIDLQ